MSAHRPIVPALLGALFLTALAGCGGGSGESTGTAASTAASAAPNAAAQGQKQAPAKQKSAGGADRGGSPNPPRQHVPEGHPTPGAKAVAPGVPTTKGGDNSVQAMGTEGEAGPRAQAVENLTAYLAAFSAHEWAKACSLASGQYRQQLNQLVANAKTKGDAKKPEGCPATLAVLFAKAPEGVLNASQVGKALSFRTKGRYAYLIYRNHEGKAMFIAMMEDGGEWKVNVPQPQPFVSGSSR